MEWIVGLVSGLGGAIATVIGFWLKFKTSNQSQDNKLINDLLDECRELRDSLSSKDSLIVDLQTEVKKLQSEVHLLREELHRYENTRLPSDAAQILEMFMNEQPKPCWIHEVGQNNWYINDAYAKIFHINRKDFWTPINVFRMYPAERAAHFVANDMAVIESGVGQYFVEEFPEKIMNPYDQENPKQEWSVVKIPVKAGGRSWVIGVCTNDETNYTLIDKYRKTND